MINIDELRTLRVDQRYTIEQLANHFNVSSADVYVSITENDIRGHKDYSRRVPLKEIKEMANNGMTASQIATATGYGRTTINRWCNQYGIEMKRIRPTAENKIIYESIKPRELRQKCSVGDTVRVKAMFPAGQGGAVFERMTRIGTVLQKTNHFIVVQYDLYRQCHLNVDLRMGVERLEIV